MASAVLFPVAVFCPEPSSDSPLSVDTEKSNQSIDAKQRDNNRRARCRHPVFLLSTDSQPSPIEEKREQHTDRRITAAAEVEIDKTALRPLPSKNKGKKNLADNLCRGLFRG